MSKKAKLVEVFAEAIAHGHKYVGVKISMPNCPEPEVIINPNANLDSKLDYYLRSYNEDLCLNTFTSIRIVDIASGNSYEELQSKLITA